MKIIDAHLHIFPSEPGTDAMARGVGHENSVEHLRRSFLFAYLVDQTANTND